MFNLIAKGSCATCEICMGKEVTATNLKRDNNISIDEIADLIIGTNH